MQLFDKKTAQVLLTASVFGLAGVFLYSAWRVIIAFLFAIFLAYLLEAPVSRVSRWLKGSRQAAIALVYLISLSVLVLLLLLAAPKVSQEGQKLMQQAPQLADNLSSGALLHELGTRHGWSPETIARIDDFLKVHRDEIIDATQKVVVGAVKTVQEMWWLLLVPILAIFFLKDGRMLGDMLVNSVKHEGNRKIVAATVAKMNLMLGDFLRAQLMLSALAMVVITLVMRLMGVQYSFVLGPAAGALEFIPVVGPFVGMAVILAVSLMTGYHHPMLLLLFLLVWRGIQGYVTSPRIMGDKLELHALAVLFGVLAGGEVAGVIGVFLSIPVLASLRILWHTWELYRESSRPVSGPAS